MILFGHPTGNPNSHHAALAYWEVGKLEAFCVPWLPEKWELGLLKAIPGLGKEAERLSRRRFEPLAAAPKVQGRPGEWGRLVRRKMGGGEELSYEANDWLMRTMTKEASHRSVKAVHSYEDCSLWQFQAAKKMGKACIYDMPIGYYGWWKKKEAELAKKYRDWLMPENVSSSHGVPPEQKKKEMEMADVVLAPSTFVAQTIREYFDKDVQILPYGAEPNVGLGTPSGLHERCQFLFAGTASVRKGVPFLLETWAKLGWKDAELVLAGSWQLHPSLLRRLPSGVRYVGLLNPKEMRQMFQESDWLVHPSNFEGFSLSILEALGAGLPVVASTATGASDLGPSSCVILFEPENRDQLIAALVQAKETCRRFRPQEASDVVSGHSWGKYRQDLVQTVLQKFANL